MSGRDAAKVPDSAPLELLVSTGRQPGHRPKKINLHLIHGRLGVLTVKG